MNNYTETEGREEMPPSPEEFFEKVVEMPVKINLRRYYHGLQKLRDKGYTFREIAEIASETLGVEINRNQIVYLLAAHPDALAEDEDREDHEDEIDAQHEKAMAETTFHVPTGVPPELFNPPSLPKKVTKKKDKAKE